MSVSQAPAGTASRTAGSVLQSWETPIVSPEQVGSSPKPIGGILTLAGLASFIRQNVKKIGSLALILFTAGIAIFSIIPARYAATALVFVDPREQHVTADPDVLPGIGQDAAALQSLIEIAKSDGFLRPLIEKLKVADDTDIVGSETDSAKVLDRFRARLDISRRGLTYVIAMTFTTGNPQQAAYYANAVAEAFVANQTKARTGAIEEAAGWLNSRLKTLNDQVRAADDAVAAYKAQHNIINAGKESTTRQLRVTDLNQQVSAARLLTEEARNRYEQAQRNLKANVEGPTGSRPDLLSTLRTQRAQLTDQIAQKRAVFGDRHPDLVISYSQLSELDRQIDTERKRNVESAKSDYETARNQQKTLEQQLASLEGEMLGDVQSSVKLQELQRNADASHNIYEQFLSRFKSTNEQRLLQSSQASIVSAATAPPRPTRPSLAVILVALVLGALLSSAAIVTVLDQAKGQTDAGPATESAAPPAADAAAILNVPVWVRIPNLALSLADRLGWRRTAVRNTEIDLRSQLQPLWGVIGAAPQQPGKVVLVTSGQGGVGKSSVARSLNAAAIERGMLSVLIRVAPEENAAPQGSLPDEDSTNNGEVVTTTARSLKLLLSETPNPKSPANPGDVRSDFNLIVIDGPSLGQQDDIAAIAAHAEFTVLVVADDGAMVQTVRNTKAALSGLGKTRLGILINQVRHLQENPAEQSGPDRRPERSASLA